jgi:aminopeptidase
VKDPRLERLADIVVHYSLGLGEGDVVLVQGPTLAEPLVVEIVRAATRAGAIPALRLAVEGTDHAFLSRASDEQLGFLHPSLVEEIEVADARISVHADWNTRSLSELDPGRLAKRQEAARPLLQRFMERSASGDLRWTVTAYPCAAFAQDADMSLEQYEDFVFGAGWLHLDDPVAAWRAFADKLTALTDRLAGVRTLRVLADGTDLTLGVADRTWIPAKGDRNFPDGEVFTAPVETETEGTIRFTYPAIRGGREVEDVRLEFAGGRVVGCEASTGADYLRKMVELDDGSAIVGEFAIGTNYAVQSFTKQILFDEKIGGTCHLALGAGYPETGSRNQSALHWDMVCDLRDGGEIHADGEVVYRDGRFVPEFAPDLSPPAA